jgi:hypothetical protein
MGVRLSTKQTTNSASPPPTVREWATSPSCTGAAVLPPPSSASLRSASSVRPVTRVSSRPCMSKNAPIFPPQDFFLLSVDCFWLCCRIVRTPVYLTIYIDMNQKCRYTHIFIRRNSLSLPLHYFSCFLILDRPVRTVLPPPSSGPPSSGPPSSGPWRPPQQRGSRGPDADFPWGIAVTNDSQVFVCVFDMCGGISLILLICVHVCVRVHTCV